MNDLQAAIKALDDGCAALHPVTVVQVVDPVEVAPFGLVYMTADDTVNPTTSRLVRHRCLELIYERHGVLHPMLQKGREAPVA